MRLHPDATTTWTDPTGATRATSPIDALHVLVLPAPKAPDAVATPATSGTTAVHSAIEFALEHALAGLTRSDHERRAALHRIPSPARGRDGPTAGRLGVDLHRPGEHRPRAGRLVVGDTWLRDARHRRSRLRVEANHSGKSDDPPF